MLGAKKALDAKALPAAGAWLGVTVGKEAELPRVRLHAVAHAAVAGRAQALACSGCVDGAALGSGVVTLTKVAFTYAGSTTKGGPASKALDLACTACVGMAELAIDADLDLKGRALAAGKVVAKDVVAGTVTASSFVGDGSKLTGIALPTGGCKGGQMVKGIAGDGSLVCASATQHSDGLAQVSGGLLTNLIDHKLVIGAPVPVPDNKPTGAAASIALPDLGTIQKLTVRAKVSNSGMKGLVVTLIDPNGKSYLLHDESAAKVLDTSWPTPTKPLSGDLGSWIGKKAKGNWWLKAVDSIYKDNKTDGTIEQFAIELRVQSSAKVRGVGLIDAAGA